MRNLDDDIELKTTCVISTVVLARCHLYENEHLYQPGPLYSPAIF